MRGSRCGSPQQSLHQWSDAVRALGLKPSAYVRGSLVKRRAGTSKETAAPAGDLSAVTVPTLAPKQLAAVHAVRVDVSERRSISTRWYGLRIGPPLPGTTGAGYRQVGRE